MKNIITTLGLFTSLSTFASTGVQECRSLMGVYNCDYVDSDMKLVLKEKSNGNYISLTLNDDVSDEIYLNGKTYELEDGSIETASCLNRNEIRIKNYQNEYTGSTLSIIKSSAGVNYNIKFLQLPMITMICTKIR